MCWQQGSERGRIFLPNEESIDRASKGITPGMVVHAGGPCKRRELQRWKAAACRGWMMKVKGEGTAGISPGLVGSLQPRSHLTSYRPRLGYSVAQEKLLELTGLLLMAEF